MRNMKKSVLRLMCGYGFNSVVFKRALKMFATLVALAIVIITLAYRGIDASLKSNLLKESEAETKKASVIFENIFRDAEYLSLNVTYENKVKTFFTASNSQILDSGLKDEAVSIIKAYSDYNSGIKNLYLYNGNAKYAVSKEKKLEESELEDAFWVEELKKEFEGDYRIAFKKNARGALQSVFFIKKYNESGFVAVELDIWSIKSKFENLISRDEEIFVLTKGELLFSSGAYIIPEWAGEIMNEKGYLNKYKCAYSVQKSQYYDFEFIGSLADSEYIKGLRNMYVGFILIFLVSLLVLGFISVAISADSFYYLSNFINLFETKKLPEKIKDDEIKYISDRIMYLINDNEKLKKEVEANVTDYNDMQYKALQKQISPHFVNNSLTALGNKIMDECGYPRETLKMLTKLTRIVKYSYVSEEIFVSFSEEIEFLGDYLTFLKYRYDNFDFEINYDPKIKNAQILKMILQPFAENSVFYAIREKNLYLNISAFCEDGFLMVKIHDNGVGMSGETIEKIMNDSKSKDFQVERVGIKNVLRRIKLIYGDNAEIEIKSKINEFTEIILKFPYRDI